MKYQEREALVTEFYDYWQKYSNDKPGRNDREKSMLKEFLPWLIGKEFIGTGTDTTIRDTSHACLRRGFGRQAWDSGHCLRNLMTPRLFKDKNGLQSRRIAICRAWDVSRMRMHCEPSHRIHVKYIKIQGR